MDAIAAALEENEPAMSTASATRSRPGRCDGMAGIVVVDGPAVGRGAAVGGARGRADPFISLCAEFSGRRRAIPADIYALIAAKRDEILAVAARYGVSNVRVFGSVARHDARPDSDLDLLVTFAPGTSLLDHAGFQLDLEDLLGMRVEVASDRGLRDRIRETVMREAVPL